MSTNTTINFKILNIATWIIFLGLCIKTGTLIFTLLISLFVNSAASGDLLLGLDLSQLMEYNRWNYISIILLIILIWGLKAFLFYLIIRLLMIAKIKSPFTPEVTNLISLVGFSALSIGVISLISTYYFNWLSEKGIDLINLGEYTIGGAEFLFTAAIVFVIAHAFKRGIEIQTENELTI